MVYSIGEGIVSPLGFSVSDTFEHIRQGLSGVACQSGLFGIATPCWTSVINRDLLREHFNEIGNSQDYTVVEQAAILSIKEAAKQANMVLGGKEVAFVISTTKGNIELLGKGEDSFERTRIYLWRMAEVIARFFGNRNKPFVVSNACISGANAQLIAQRLLEEGLYQYVVVVGVDMLSRFVLSGFQSFQSLSSGVCKPFDKERTGLNLGEGAGTIIYTKEPQPNGIVLCRGAVRNDANHISGPSRTGEGAFLALSQIMEEVDIEKEVGFVNAHGTATIYNDDMESIALKRAGLENVFINSLKGYLGHTLGAAGLIESILSMKSIQNNFVFATKGFENLGVVENIRVASEFHRIDKKYFVKMLSGFGGSNAALLFKKIG